MKAASSRLPQGCLLEGSSSGLPQGCLLEGCLQAARLPSKLRSKDPSSPREGGAEISYCGAPGAGKYPLVTLELLSSLVLPRRPSSLAPPHPLTSPSLQLSRCFQRMLCTILVAHGLAPFEPWPPLGQSHSTKYSPVQARHHFVPALVGKHLLQTIAAKRASSSVSCTGSCVG